MKLDYELPEKVKLKVLQSLMTEILYAVPLGMDVVGQRRNESWFVIGEDKWLTVQDGEIIILDGHKSYPTDNNGKHPDLIWGDAMSELRPDDEVIAKFEKYGISWDKAKEFRERWEQEAERDKAFLH